MTSKAVAPQPIPTGMCVCVCVCAGVASYTVTGPTGSAVTAQLLPLSAADTYLRTT